MSRNIFFSWQSDLPNSTNRNFLESCIKNATKTMKQDPKYKLELNIDRDTLSKIGTPDITQTIFNRIDKCCFYIADVSIINGNSRKYRKTPNPNVMIELGYAAKKLGWERIICVFNLDYGKLSDLPFDLRNRRILTYQTKIDKSVQKKFVAKIIKSIFEQNYDSTILSNELMDYYNVDIYFSLLRVILDFAKFIFGYEKINDSRKCINNVLSLGATDIAKLLKQNYFIGFLLFKSYENHVKELSAQLEKIVQIKNYDDDYYVPIVRLIKTLRLYNKELNRRGDLDKVERVKSCFDDYSLLGESSRTGSETRLVLLKKLDCNKSVVKDFGDFQRKDHIANLLVQFKLKSESLKFYSGFLFEAIEEINKWIDNNDGEFILDETQLEIR